MRCLTTTHPFALSRLTLSRILNSDTAERQSLSKFFVALHRNCRSSHIVETISLDIFCSHLSKFACPKLHFYGMGLAPMSVATHCQRQGIGSFLVTNGLKRLTETECAFVVVLGHPDYYPRFGFVPASDFGVSHGFTGIPQDVFFIHHINENDTMKTLANGLTYYQPEFGPQHVGT